MPQPESKAAPIAITAHALLLIMPPSQHAEPAIGSNAATACRAPAAGTTISLAIPAVHRARVTLRVRSDTLGNSGRIVPGFSRHRDFMLLSIILQVLVNYNHRVESFLLFVE